MVRAAALGLLISIAAVQAQAADYRQEFPYPKAAVYQAVVGALPGVGFKIRDQDPTLSRITAVSGITLASSGENLSVAVNDAGEGKSVLSITATMKRGIQDAGRLQRIADRVIAAASASLRSSPPLPALEGH